MFVFLPGSGSETNNSCSGPRGCIRIRIYNTVKIISQHNNRECSVFTIHNPNLLSLSFIEGHHKLAFRNFSLFKFFSLSGECVGYCEERRVLSSHRIPDIPRYTILLSIYLFAFTFILYLETLPNCHMATRRM